jgi:hypothetical protein
LANGEAKSDVKKSLEEVAVEQNRVPEAVADRDQHKSRDQLMVTSKPHSLVSSTSGQKKASRTTAPGMAPAPRWCPPGLTPSQRRRIQQMRAHKMREESVERERD